MLTKSVIKLSLSVYFLSYFISASVIRNDGLFKLDIVHYNDFHDRFEETTVNFPGCKTNDTKCLGGFARLYHEIKTLLREKPNALVLNAGDVFQGTYWYTLLKWNVTQHFINMIPNDAHTVGNHEYDDGIAGLAPYLAALRAPVLIANLDASKEPSLNGLYLPHIIIEREGRKIGIIGVTTVETKKSSNPGKNVIFLDPMETVKREAQQLTDEGVDIIVILSHCGLKLDKQIAKDVGENIDIIVGGHSHSLLWNGESPSKEEISGPYPVLVESASKPDHKILVVTASAFTKYVGNVTAYFDKNGELVNFDGEPVFLNRSIPEDPEIKALLQPYADALHNVVNEVVGFADNSLLAWPCGSGECTIGNIITDAFLNATKEKKVSNLPHVVFLLRNTIRGSIDKGNITKGAIINTTPFTNKVVTLVISGRYLYKIMERCLTVSWRENPFIGPWMPQIAGMVLTLNTTSKTVESMYHKGEQLEPIEMDLDYQLITLDFLSNGRSGFDVIKKYGHDVRVVGVDNQIIIDYVRKISPISDKLDNRLIIHR